MLHLSLLLLEVKIFLKANKNKEEESKKYIYT